MRTSRILIGNIYKCTHLHKVDSYHYDAEYAKELSHLESEVVKENAVFIRKSGQYEDVEDATMVLTPGPNEVGCLYVVPKELRTYNEVLNTVRKEIGLFELGLQLPRIKYESSQHKGLDYQIVGDIIRVELNSGAILIMDYNKENLQRAYDLTGEKYKKRNLVSSAIIALLKGMVINREEYLKRMDEFDQRLEQKARAR